MYNHRDSKPTERLVRRILKKTSLCWCNSRNVKMPALFVLKNLSKTRNNTVMPDEISLVNEQTTNMDIQRFSVVHLITSLVK